MPKKRISTPPEADECAILAEAENKRLREENASLKRQLQRAYRNAQTCIE